MSDTNFEDCPLAEGHGNPFRYCACGWIEPEEEPTYSQRVQATIDVLVEMAENAENANNNALSGWYGSVCKWVREQEEARKGFTLTLPDPTEGGDPLTVIEVKATR